MIFSATEAGHVIIVVVSIWLLLLLSCVVQALWPGCRTGKQTWLVMILDDVWERRQYSHAASRTPCSDRRWPTSGRCISTPTASTSSMMKSVKRGRCPNPPAFTALSPVCITYINPLKCRGSYSSTSNDTKLVHWPLMGGLLHLVQQRGDWVEPQPAQVLPHCTKYNSPPINGRCTNHCIAV